MHQALLCFAERPKFALALGLPYTVLLVHLVVVARLFGLSEVQSEAVVVG